MNDFKNWEQKAKLLRRLSLTSTTAAGSGHPTSCLSAADIMTVLFDRYFAYDLGNPRNPTNDRLLFSKGHAAPLLYALFAVAGAFSFRELGTLRKFGSRLEGHPTPAFPFADVATGSLGQGLSIGAGMAYGMKQSKLKVQHVPKVYILLGDGELAEGQIWEAANFASYYQLDNLIAIADINSFGQSQKTMFDYHIEEYERRFSAFGFATAVIDGHNFQEIDDAFHAATQNVTGKPFVILAKTNKGQGISFLQNKANWHGKALKPEELEKAVKELGDVDESLRFTLKRPLVIPIQTKQSHQRQTTSFFSEGDTHPDAVVSIYKKGDQVSTREVYGKVLASIAEMNPSIYALDGDVKNSTYSKDFLEAHSDRFIECYIAEQNMVSVAVGLSSLQYTPFVSTFAAFFMRAADQIRMAAISRANIRFVGSHAGVSIGEDGPSQMGLEDIAFFGALPESTILQPCDAVSAAKLLTHMSIQSGISYLRTLRPKTPVLYSVSEEFAIGGSKVLRSCENDEMTIAATGITVHEALKAQGELAKEGIAVRVVDCYSIKPVDKATLFTCLKATRHKIIVSVEDHFEHGGLGDFILHAVSDTGAKVYKLAVSHIPRSGMKDELLEDAGISAKHIVQKIKEILAS